MSIVFDSWNGIESTPWSVIDYEKFQTFLELCKIRDEFLNSLTTVRYYNYIIDRKLVEAGGLGKTVYIYPARGANRSTSMERIMELIESGRDVKFVRASDICTKPNRSYGPYDHDLWDHLDSTLTQKLYEELRYQELQRDIYQLLNKELYNPTFKTLDYEDDVHNHKLFNDWYIYGGTINNDAIAVIKPDSNLD